ncbi:GNAT family N-acetyltransferase [Massilia sp. IC2-476]|uniref:GNAT family N-acetyltransferase n=1 Tax=Massilia sp. IC2-476 TaxID=2887199 RepID=UPI001D0F9E86|nr:GNAT family N-acetyltransferase [Massilia sp. IC2-476]MCC2973038.1 GNAT family N-acetyltransferase [Massilia sp. IC2-476]
MKWRLLPAARFGAAAAHWDALRAGLPAAPMFAPAFVDALLEAFGSGPELLALCEDEAGPCAAAVLAPQGPGRWATFQPAQAPLGLWLQRPGIPAASLLAGLGGALPGFALQLGLTQCDPLLLPRPAPGAGDNMRTLDYIATARIDVTGGFEDYWNGRGKNLRANLKKQRKRLAADGIATRLDVVDQPGMMAAAVADYGRLEGAGWKARGGTAVDAGNAQGLFYARMLEAFARDGGARAYRYWFGERLVAMDLCILERDTIVILKTAYDESAADGLSPALLMREEACRALFDEERFARIEFYGRVMEWHTRWTDQVRTLYHLNHYRWPALARLHAMLRERGAAHLQNGA